MKYEEQIASTYLATLGLGAAVFEPDGNVPPDFVLSNVIAVEVRRLNKHVDVDGVNEGLEQAEIPLMKAVEAALRKFDVAWAGSTYFAFIRFTRPLPDRKTLASKLANVLEAFLQNPRPNSRAIFVDAALSIDMIAATPVPGLVFLVGGNSDPDRGGWIVDDYRANIQLCSDEKISKVAPYRTKYDRWWLLLVDFIGYGLDDFDRAQLKRTTPLVHNWDKIIVVNPLDPSDAFEV